jgi:methylenetetrahydrofolate dehydrogenase (NADP+)/methenyltetrahydrofolate cyclohydrolase
MKESGLSPTLAVVLVGNEPASKIYVKGKRKDCEEVGIDFKLYELPANVDERELLELVKKLNEDESIHGVIIQLPLPKHINFKRVVHAVSPRKDVDGLNSYNIGRLWSGTYNLDGDLLPCTPKGVMKLLSHYKVDLEGKLVVIVNRSDLVGKPLAKLFLDKNATVLICHSKTPDLKKQASSADVLVLAVGRRPSFVANEEMLKPGAVVIDVGSNYVDGKLCGDVDFDRVKEKASYITPTPGGVGPMTRTMLLSNVLIAARLAIRMGSNKNGVRAKLKSLRLSLTDEEVATRSEEIKKKLFELPEFQRARTVAFYVAKKSSREVETEKMIRESISMGKRVLVPIVEAEKKLCFSELFDFDSDLAPGTFGILEPKAEARRPVPFNEMDFIIVPGVAFDLRGNRLGQGGGYYDRLLGDLVKIKPSLPIVGLAFEVQVVDKLANGSHDVPIKILVTEKKISRFN